MIFEFWFDPGDPAAHREYLAESDRLRALLPTIRGLEKIEKFQSVSDPHRYVAIAAFEDEASVAAWRRNQDHRRAQELGRDRFFAGYRLRMAEVVRDYGLEA